MKTKQVWALALLAGSIFIANGQTIVETTALTSGGLNAGSDPGTIGNTFFGYRAGAPTSSDYNTFIGYLVGAGADGAHDNVYVGNQAGGTTDGASHNVCIGSNAGYSSYFNANNVLIGSKAGYSTDGSGNIMLGYNAGYSERGSNKLYIENSNSTTPLIYGDFSANKLVFNGKVGITNETLVNQANLFPTTAGGVNVSAYQLFVKGGILTEEVRVMLKNTTNWADYVFEDGYSLKPLSEVECFIKENGRLPNMPSAEQITEEGIEVGEMAKMQQEKIEELTLYVIEQNKQLEQQQKEIEELKVMVQQLLNDKK